jgi:hypothetical protein
MSSHDIASNVCQAILHGLADAVEKVREKCATLVSEIVGKLTDLEPILKSLMPAVVKCVGTQPVEAGSRKYRMAATSSIPCQTLGYRRTRLTW